MSHYITCHNCGEPECMDSDTGVHRRDDGTVCPDPRDAEVEGLRAEVARLTRDRDELAVFRTAGHAETCNGKNEVEGWCACGYLQRQGGHAALVAAWAERDELARWRATHTVTPTIRIRAEAAEAEVERLRAALDALAKATEFPDHIHEMHTGPDDCAGCRIEAAVEVARAAIAAKGGSHAS